MSDEEHGALDDRFLEWLAACDDSLAQGLTASSSTFAGLPCELRAQLERDVAWCRFVRHAWPHKPPAPNPLSHAPTERGPEPPALLPEAKPRVSQPLSQLGRYRIRSEIGRGGFGVVYLGYDPALRREVALKVPRPELVLTPDARERFRHEGHAAASLDHPNIVPVYDAGEEGAVCFLASAYCPGITLGHWLKYRQEPLPPRMAAHLVALLAGAVEHAHRRGVLHRDLKPGNVLLVPGTLGLAADLEFQVEGLGLVPRITDFGLAKFWGSALESISLTHTGAIMGTPHYMAPEQADGAPGRFEPTSDVYALGAILYELLSGRTPFQANTPIEILWRARVDEVVPLRQLRADLPRDLETICLKCLEKDPQRRYASAGALNDDLRRFLSQNAIQARPPGLAERMKRWARRQPAFAAVGLLCLVVAATAAVCVLALRGERSATIPTPAPITPTEQELPRFDWAFSEGTLPPGTSTVATEILDSGRMGHKDGTILRFIEGGKSWIDVKFALKTDARLRQPSAGRWMLVLVHHSTDVIKGERGFSPVKITVNGQTVFDGSPDGPTSAETEDWWVTTRIDVTDKLRPGTNHLRWDSLPGSQTHYWLKSFRIAWEPVDHGRAPG